LQLSPNAREVALELFEAEPCTHASRRVDAPGASRLPAPTRRSHADAAAARAALAAVTRLEVDGEHVKRAHLEAVLRRLPGLREVSLVCDCVMGAWNAEKAAAYRGAALAGCPGLESLEWRMRGFFEPGEWGTRGGRCTPGRARAVAACRNL
jgi:hypothetical protein